MRIVEINSNNGNPIYTVQVEDNRFIDIIHHKDDWSVVVDHRNTAQKVVYDNNYHCFAFDGDLQTVIDLVRKFSEYNMEDFVDNINVSTKKNSVTLYWPSAIVQKTPDSKPELQFTSMGEISLEKAMEMIEFFKSQYIVLSAWVNTYEDKVKHTVFHECYVDAFGYVQK